MLFRLVELGKRKSWLVLFSRLVGPGPLDFLAQRLGDGRRIVEEEQTVLGKVIEQSFERVEGGQKSFRPEERAAAHHVFHQGARPRGRQVDVIAERTNHLARAFHRAGLENRLARGRQPQLFQLARSLVRGGLRRFRVLVGGNVAALARRSEWTKRKNKIAIKLEPNGKLAGGRPQIEHRSPHREGSG